MRLLGDRPGAVAAFAALSWSLLGGGASAEARWEIELASRASGADGKQANANASNPAISAKGDFVAFVSGASNLVADDRDGIRDIFVRDRRSDETILVSRASGASGPKANATSSEPAISANGRFVAFASFAENLVPEASGEEQLFVRDLVENTTALVSRASGPGGAPADVANFFGYSPSISADGSRVAFQTPANLDPADTDGAADVYVRDLNQASTTLASRASGAGGRQSTKSSYDPSISGDGTGVAFTLIEGDLFESEQGSFEPSSVWLRDLTTYTTTLVSRESGPNGRFHGNNGSASISANATRVAFKGPRTLEPSAGLTSRSPLSSGCCRSSVSMARGYPLRAAGNRLRRG